ncbi:hypothetical protein WJX81_004692 [Elliptochloris bilobata]|uniref:BZIP domain-containing protein n=1 Tax=Elliptochloris bilobata TaxID=381761 RepID=A0AAW1S453_9CHLO
MKRHTPPTTLAHVANPRSAPASAGMPLNPNMSLSLDERTVAALLHEDESTFNMLGSLLPSAALAAAAGHAGEGAPLLQAANAAAMHHLLQLHSSQGAGNPGGPAAGVRGGAPGGAPASEERMMSETEAEAARLKKVQDKNRRNQRKFRARQKEKLESSEAQVRELSERLALLEREKVELELRASALASSAGGAVAAGLLGGAEDEDAPYFDSLSAFVSKMYHTKLVQLFEDGAENPNSEAHEQLVDLLALKYAMLNEATGNTDTPRLAKWQSILAALDLGEEQKQRLLAARTYLLAQMVEIIQERTLIISMLQGAVPSMEEGRQQNAG